MVPTSHHVFGANLVSSLVIYWVPVDGGDGGALKALKGLLNASALGVSSSGKKFGSIDHSKDIKLTVLLTPTSATSSCKQFSSFEHPQPLRWISWKTSILLQDSLQITLLKGLKT